MEKTNNYYRKGGTDKTATSLEIRRRSRLLKSTDVVGGNLIPWIFGIVYLVFLLIFIFS